MNVGDLVDVVVTSEKIAREKAIGTLLTGQIVAVRDKAIQIRGTSVLRRPPPDGEAIPCRLCNRPLTEEASKSIGYGPDCAVQLGLTNKFIRNLHRSLTRDETQAAERSIQTTVWLPKAVVEVMPQGQSVLREEEIRRQKRAAVTQVRETAVVTAGTMRHEEVLTDPLPVALPLDCELRPYQWRAVRFGLDRRRFFELDLMGLGKGHPVGTGVLTPTGWRSIGDLQVGDRVIGSTGKAITVTGVHPRGKLPVYKVTMSDGANVTVDGDHLWAVRTAAQKYAGQPYRAVETRQLMSGPLKDKRNNSRHYIPVVDPIEMDEAGPFLIDPYILGVLLGDGSLTHGRVTFTKPDEEMGKEVEKLLPEGSQLHRSDTGGRCPTWTITGTTHGVGSNPVLNELRAIGIYDKAAHEKAVPDRYKFSSLRSRLSLLQGLLDTDGSVGPGGSGAEFSSTSHQLALDVQFLVESLGGTTNLRERQTYFTGGDGQKKAGKLSYRVQIALPGNVQPFRLSRKAEQYVVPTKYQPTRAITAIDPVGESEVVCISVDAPDRLYVTEHCIVTHNSVIGSVFMLEAMRRLAEAGRQGPCLIVPPPVMCLTWKRELQKWIQGARVQILKGYSAKIDPKADFYIMPYSILSSGWQPLRDSRGNVITVMKERKDGTHREATVPDVGRVQLSGTALGVLDQRPTIVIFDECHALKGLSSQRSLAAQSIVLPAEYVAMMSGTAVLNRPEELINQLEVLGIMEEAFESRAKFEEEFANKTLEWQNVGGGKRRKIWKYKPARGGQLVELHRRLVPYAIRRRTEDVLSDMPALNLARVVVDLANRAAVEQLEEEIAQLPPMQRLGQLAKLRQLVGIGKIPSIIEWIENFLECEEKLVVFATHRAVQRAILDHFEKWKPAEILGRAEGSTDKKRQESMDRFQNDPNCLLCVCSTGSAREGITLTAADNLLMCELEWTPGVLEQAAKRVHRYGKAKEETVTIWTLAAEESMDDTLLEKLYTKKILTGEILDGNGEVPDEDIIRDAVIRDLVLRVARRKKKGGKVA